MRRANEMIQFKKLANPRRFALKNIQGCSGHFAQVHGVIKIVFIHNTTTGTVDDHYAILHLIESILVDQTGGVFEFGDMHRDIIRSFV